MASLADQMSEHDAVIFGAIGEVAVIRGTRVSGVYRHQYREVQIEGGDTVEGLAISFACQITPAIRLLQDGDKLTIEGQGDFLFLRRVPTEGDESGLVYLELGVPGAT